jgi:hypothetical protein
MLHGHDEVYMPARKELAFFTIEANYNKGIAYYSSHFRGVSKEKAIGEATPDYLHKEVAPGRIHELLPGIRLICSLRDPIERAFSSYLMQISKGSEPLGKTFEQAIVDTPHYLEYGMYATQIERYLKLFPREHIKIFLLEDLKEDPQLVFDELCEFLGIEKRKLLETDSLSSNIGGMPRHAVVQKAVSQLYRCRNAIRETRLAGAVTNPFVDRWARRARNKLASWNRDKSNYPTLDPRIRESLVPLFKEENERLADILERDLTHWNRVA